jgi:hypothetical protein
MRLVKLDDLVGHEYADEDEEDDEEVSHNETGLGELIVDRVVPELQEGKEDGIKDEDVAPLHYHAILELVHQQRPARKPQPLRTVYLLQTQNLQQCPHSQDGDQRSERESCIP